MNSSLLTLCGPRVKELIVNHNAPSIYNCLFFGGFALVCFGLLCLCIIQSNKASAKLSAAESKKEDGKR